MSSRSALWAACEAAAAAGGGCAVLRLQAVPSLAALEAQHGPYAATVVAAGAASGGIAEIGGRLPTASVLSASELDNHHPPASSGWHLQASYGSVLWRRPPQAVGRYR